MTAPQMVTLDTFYEELVEISSYLYKKALTDLPQDVRSAVSSARENEEGIGRKFLDIMVKSIDVSDETGIILCQDTGICIFFVRWGGGFPLKVRGDLVISALRQGIALATEIYDLRSSIVHPITRRNTQDNLGERIPDVHFEFDGSDEFEVRLLPKGSGSENMSFLKMLSPADGIDEVKKFIVESVFEAGPRPCPPTIVGVGMGGTADLCMSLAKKAVLRPVGSKNPDQEVAQLEQEMLTAINTLEIGPQGLGGKTTSFALHIEYAATHISMNPVAVNIQCWRGERASAKISSDGAVTYGY